MDPTTDFNAFYEAWAANTCTSLQFFAPEWCDANSSYNNIPTKSFSAPPTAPPSPFSMDFAEPSWDWSEPTPWRGSAVDFETPDLSGCSRPSGFHDKSDHRRLIPESTDSAASSPRTFSSSVSASPSPQTTPRSIPEGRGRSTEQQTTEPVRRLSRKAQNRAAQQAHRERKRKLIEDLWTEIHHLRLQNGKLQKQLQAKTEMLQYVCQRTNTGSTSI